MERTTKKKGQTKHSKRRLIISAAATAVVLALVIGLSYAWFFNQSNIATLISIAPPSPIAIKGPHGQSLTSLDLTYTDADKDEQSKKVTIRRVISIENGGREHKIEIVHTTNLKGLTFQLYKASEVQNANASDGTISEGGYTYKYDTTNPIKGSYINAALETTDYKSAVENSAENSKHSKNYGEYTLVQKHAEPIYWITDNALEADSTIVDTTDSASSGDSTEAKKHRTYYVLEISWTETTKETDIFYVLAKDN